MTPSLESLAELATQLETVYQASSDLLRTLQNALNTLHVDNDHDSPSSNSTRLMQLAHAMVVAVIEEKIEALYAAKQNATRAINGMCPEDTEDPLLTLTRKVLEAVMLGKYAPDDEDITDTEEAVGTNTNDTVKRSRSE